MVYRDLRDRAAKIVDDLADRLADPARVAELAGAPDNIDLADGRPPTPSWRPGELNGHPGIALLFAELGRPEVAHAHLVAAGPSIMDHPSLYHGWSGYGLALRATARDERDYANVLATVDERISLAVPAMLAGEPEGDKYDLISGLAGVAAYQLTAPQSDERILSHLTSLAEPRGDLPGWWLARPPAQSTGRPQGGYADLGLAHGIPGVLAVLASAWGRDRRVPGQDRAIDTIATWLFEHAHRSVDAISWPSFLTLDELRRGISGNGDRSAWCYGTPGVASALHLAAVVRGRTDWARAAGDALDGVLRRDLTAVIGPDPSICHGWAGLALLAMTLGRDADALVARVLDLYRPDAPFGFQHRPVSGPQLGPDRPGLLDGAAGIALVLRAYVTGRARTPWLNALLASPLPELGKGSPQAGERGQSHQRG